MALNALQRLDLEDQLMTLIARCLVLEHPQAARMAHVTLSHAASLSDEKLVDLSDRLTAWVAETEAAQQPGVLASPAEVGS